MPSKIDIVKMKFNHLTVIEDLGGGKVLCQCDCENKTILECYKKNVKSGKQKSCGCASRKNPITNIEGQQFGNWIVKKELGHGKVLCECQCEDKTVRELYKKAVISGQTKSCGCMRTKNCNSTKLQTGSLESKYSKMKFGEWTVIKRIPNSTKLLCRCSCGKEQEVYIQHLLNGESKSCGHNKTKFEREPWQVEVVSTKEKMKEYLESLGYKPRISDLMELLALTQTGVYNVINRYNLNDYIEYSHNGKSDLEIELYNFIKSKYDGIIIRNERKIFNNKYELDIYIPEKKLAFEFNGNYWHSDINKSPDYHQIKTLECSKVGIRLVHIFEYEWVNNKEIIKKYISDIFNTNKVYARKLIIKEVNRSLAENFIDENHLQGWSNSSINIALMNEDSYILGIMTFGKPRFSVEYEYELIRMCFKHGFNIVGGAQRMFKYFLNNYNPDSIICYSDIAKFTAATYLKLGFNPIQVTKPSYVWCNAYNGEVLKRYQTTKQKLVDSGLGNYDNTEDEIMKGHDYFKIYNSGNLKLLWNKN